MDWYILSERQIRLLETMYTNYNFTSSYLTSDEWYVLNYFSEGGESGQSRRYWDTDKETLNRIRKKWIVYLKRK